MSPQIIFNYIPNLKNTYSNQFQEFEENGNIVTKDILGGTYANNLNEESQKLDFHYPMLFK